MPARRQLQFPQGDGQARGAVPTVIIMGKTELNPKQLDARGLRVAVVAARYNPKVADGLLKGALLVLQEMGLPETEIDIYRVPGAFELPLLAQQLAKTGKADAVVCLGVVIRGDTSHFD
ncbi:6,7-dimethyl-8-ribityllumazine synthase, partial [bacterium]